MDRIQALEIIRTAADALIKGDGNLSSQDYNLHMLALKMATKNLDSVSYKSTYTVRYNSPTGRVREVTVEACSKNDAMDVAVEQHFMDFFDIISVSRVNVLDQIVSEFE